MNWGTVPEWLMAIFALATAYFAYGSDKTAKALAWLIGSLESHSTVRLRMEAKEKGLKVIAYNPKHSRYPARVPLEGEEWPLEVVYLALPVEFREAANDAQP